MRTNLSRDRKLILWLLTLAILLAVGPLAARGAEPGPRITGFCIDFNWASGGPNGDGPWA